MTATGKDTGTLLLCDKLRSTPPPDIVLYVARMVICYQPNDEPTLIHGKMWRRLPTIVWYAEASLWGIKTEISEFSARSSSKMQSSAHSRDTEGTGESCSVAILIGSLGPTITVNRRLLEEERDIWWTSELELSF